MGTMKEQVYELNEKLINYQDSDRNVWIRNPEHTYYLTHSETANYYEEVVLNIMLSETYLKIKIWDSENNQLMWNEKQNDYETLEKLVGRTLTELGIKVNEIKKVVKLRKTQ